MNICGNKMVKKQDIEELESGEMKYKPGRVKHRRLGLNYSGFQVKYSLV